MSSSSVVLFFGSVCLWAAAGFSPASIPLSALLCCVLLCCVLLCLCFVARVLMPPPCVGPTSYGTAAFSPVAVGSNCFFPLSPSHRLRRSIRPLPAACCFLHRSSCFSVASVAFQRPFYHSFSVICMLFSCALCSFVNRVWTGHLADELLVRVLERCDRFARLLRIAL